MSKIARKTQKIFGSTAGANQLATFGSLAAGTPAFTTDPAVIQSLANYLTGWFGAIVGSQSPAIEDMNALFYLLSYQMAYVMQAGFPEWDTGTTYFIGSLTQDGFGAAYKSLTDSNQGHALSDGTNWVRGAPGQLPLGSVIATFPNLTGAYTTTATTVADALGFVKCGGQTLADSNSPMNGQVIPNVNNSIFLQGSTSAGTSGGSATASLVSGNLPSHTHTFTSTTSVAASGHTHNMAHAHVWGFNGNTSGQTFGLLSGSTPSSRTSISASDSLVTTLSPSVASGSNSAMTTTNVNSQFFTSGVAAGPNSGTGSSALTGTESSDTTVAGTTDPTGSGTAFSIVPSYITAVYLMRVR